MNAILAYLKAHAELAQKCGQRTNPYIQFLLDHGRPYLAGPNSFRGRKGKAHQCYANAGRLALDGCGTYCEGYVTVCGIPIEHAWIMRDGLVIETTIRRKKHESEDSNYFGVEFNAEYLRARLLETKVWGLLAVAWHKIDHGLFDGTRQGWKP